MTDNTQAVKQITFTGELLDYNNYRKYSSTFVETGTCLGDGVQRALDAGFDFVLSCEANDIYYQTSVERFKQVPTVFLYDGKSVDVLSKMLRLLIVEVERNYVIFLDAHPAGPNSAGHDELMADPNSEWNQDKIIKAELEIILAQGHDHVIIIDDVNGVDDGCADQYMNIMLAANPNYRFEFWDECLSGDSQYFYKNKILVALP